MFEKQPPAGGFSSWLAETELTCRPHISGFRRLGACGLLGYVDSSPWRSQTHAFGELETDQPFQEQRICVSLGPRNMRERETIGTSDVRRSSKVNEKFLGNGLVFGALVAFESSFRRLRTDGPSPVTYESTSI